MYDFSVVRRVVAEMRVYVSGAVLVEIVDCETVGGQTYGQSFRLARNCRTLPEREVNERQSEMDMELGISIEEDYAKKFRLHPS